MQLFSKSPILEINSLLSAILRPLEQHCVEPLGQAKTHGRLAQREQVSVSRSEHQARSAQRYPYGGDMDTQKIMTQ
ncbi:uncharacterized protein LOC144495692 isoform X2 [Mustelus asterias]